MLAEQQRAFACLQSKPPMKSHPDTRWWLSTQGLAGCLCASSTAAGNTRGRAEYCLFYTCSPRRRVCCVGVRPPTGCSVLQHYGDGMQAAGVPMGGEPSCVHAGVWCCLPFAQRPNSGAARQFSSHCRANPPETRAVWASEKLEGQKHSGMHTHMGPCGNAPRGKGI